MSSITDITTLFWQDGIFKELNSSKLDIKTHALHYGTAVFEGIRSYSFNIYKLEKHIERLYKSAELIGLKIILDKKTIEDACTQLIKINEMSNAYIRPIAYKTSGTLKVIANNPISVVIIAWNRKDKIYRDLSEKKPISLDISKWQKPSPYAVPVQSKASGYYLMNSFIGESAKSNGFDDSLMLDFEGYIAEATTSNIFFVKNNELYTPIADRFLNGITRQTIIEIAKSNNIKVNEKRMLVEELDEYEECFVCGTSNEITAVKNIGNHIFNNNNLTNKINNLFFDDIYNN